jgi:alpha-ribazole phosphatase
VQIFLIRHPQALLPPSVCYGHTDTELVPEALLNLQTTASSLRAQMPDTFSLYSSPLLRCRLLAEALHPQAAYDDRLKEMFFGVWENRCWDNIPRQQIDDWALDPMHYQIPGGESALQMQTRVLDFINEKQKQNIQNLVLVTHSGVMKIIVAQAQQLPITEWMNLRFDYASLHQIHRDL